MNLVTDCSFIMSSILPDENQTKIEDIYKQIGEGIYKVYVPSIFYLECNNVLLCSLRKKRINKDNYNDYSEILGSLPINIDNFSSTADSFYTIGNISNQYNLTSYDASYIDLAIRMGAAIATLDKNLANACKQANLELLEI